MPLRLSVVMVSLRSVIPTGLHAAFLEIYFRNRMGTDRSGPTSQRAPYRSVQRGNPRFTLVSDGKPLRRLLVISKRNSFSTCVLLPGGFARHSTEGEPRNDYSDPEVCAQFEGVLGECMDITRSLIGNQRERQMTQISVDQQFDFSRQPLWSRGVFGIRVNVHKAPIPPWQYFWE
jgi:hypothetical protein